MIPRHAMRYRALFIRWVRWVQPLAMLAISFLVGVMICTVFNT